MTAQLPETEAWLSLTDAANYLGVHPTTLRRWADQGQIPFMATPGGHRRFAASDVARFTQNRRSGMTQTGLGQVWAEHALAQARSEMVEQRDANWMAPLDQEERERKRQLGRRLMGLTLQYVSAEAPDEALLDEARVLGKQYAADALASEMTLTEALQAAMFFRDTLVEAAIDLPDSVHVQPKTSKQLLRRINALLNVVQLAIADAYASIM